MIDASERAFEAAPEFMSVFAQVVKSPGYLSEHFGSKETRFVRCYLPNTREMISQLMPI
jgi:hypothetical protein